MINRYGVICKDFNYQELTQSETLVYLKALLNEIIPAKERIDAEPDALHDQIHVKYVYDNYAALVELIQVVEKADCESYFYVDKDRIHLYNSDVAVFILGKADVIRYSCFEGELKSSLCPHEDFYIDLLLWTKFEKPLIVRDTLSYAKASAMAKVKMPPEEEHNYKILYTVDDGYNFNKCIAIIHATSIDAAKEHFMKWWETTRRNDESLSEPLKITLIVDKHILYTGRR